MKTWNRIEMEEKLKDQIRTIVKMVNIINPKSEAELFAAALPNLVSFVYEEFFSKQDKERWIIWSIEHDGWWAPNHSGYVECIENAGKYTYDEALKIVHGANYHKGMHFSPTMKGRVKPNEAMIKITT